MADSKSDPSSGKAAKAPNVFERMKEEFEAVLHNDNKNKETHGLRDDIDSNSSTSDVKAPNVFERAKEEIEALVEAIHHKKESTKGSADKDCSKSNKPEKDDFKAASHTVKVQGETAPHGQKPHHHKETHGTSYDIDENTPISQVKGPNVFERAREEIEALIQTIHPKKDSPKKDSGNGVSSPKKEG